MTRSVRDIQICNCSLLSSPAVCECVRLLDFILLAAVVVVACNLTLRPLQLATRDGQRERERSISVSALVCVRVW